MEALSKVEVQVSMFQEGTSRKLKIFKANLNGTTYTGSPAATTLGNTTRALMPHIKTQYEMRGKYKNGRIITDKTQYKKEKPAKSPVAGDDTAIILRK